MSVTLSTREQLFVDRYLVHGGKARAAVEAGYAKSSAHVTASRLLKKAKVNEAIDAGVAEQRAKLKVSPEQVIDELAKIGFADPAGLYDENDNPIPPHLLHPHLRAAVKSVKVDEAVDSRAGLQLSLALVTPDGQPFQIRVRTREVVLHDKIRALELLGRHFKLWGDDDGLAKDAGKTLGALLAELHRRGSER